VGTGAAQLVLELRDAATGQVDVRRELGRVEIRGRDGRPAANVRPDRTLDAQFGDVIALRGLTLDPATAVRPGRDQALNVTLFWESVKPTDVSYTVFVQLLSPEGRLVTQHDGPPDEGRSPTSGWGAGEVIVDAHEVPIERTLPAGEYRLITGLYEPRSGQRLTLPDGRNFTDLASITVSAP
jgi:hypothetical protein